MTARIVARYTRYLIAPGTPSHDNVAVLPETVYGTASRLFGGGNRPGSSGAHDRVLHSRTSARPLPLTVPSTSPIGVDFRLRPPLLAGSPMPLFVTADQCTPSGLRYMSKPKYEANG